MPLNVPYTHPIIPVLMYDPAMPPALPHVHVPEMVQGIVPMVAVELINQLGMRANSSPVRMACYNQAVINNFMNQEFKELLELACQYLVLKYKKSYIRTPQEGISESVNELLTLWASNTLLIHPELKASCSPQIVNAAYQNAPVFQNLKVEIQTMMNQQPPQMQQPMQQSNIQQPMQQMHPQNWQGGYPQQPQVQQWQGGYPQQPQVQQWQGGYPQQPQVQQQWGQPQQLPPGQWVANQYGQQVFIPAQPHMQQQWPQQPPQQPWGGGTGNFQYQRPVTNDPRMQGGYGQPNVVEASNMAKDVALQSRFMGQLSRHNQTPNLQKDAGPTPAPPPPTSGQSTYNQNFTTQPSPIVNIESSEETQPFKFKELKIKGGSEMDRANHAVAYFGEEIKDNTSVQRQEVFSKSADELAKASASPLELPDGVEAEVNDSGVQVSNIVHYDVTEESLLLEAKMKYIESRDGDTPSPMFRIFGKVATPFVGRKSLSNLQANLRSVNSLTKLAERMKMKMRDALVGKGGLRSPDDLDAVAYLNFLDAYFTKKVNNILKNNLQANLLITSFTTDVSGIGDFLRENRNPGLAYAWDQCSTSLYTRYISGFDNELESTIEGNYNVPENLCMVMTPSTFSYTFTELTLSELGFEFTDNPVGINREKAPALYKIASSLAKHKKELEVDTDVDYLVTSDGAKYIIYKNHAATGENFLIGEAV